MSGSKKVLIVDDVDMNIMLLNDVLEGDFELQDASSGEDALIVVDEFRPDIVLLDVMMPGMDGCEVCQKLRENPEYHGLKIIMMSGRASKDDVERGLACGADKYLTKPFDVINLHSMLMEIAQN